MANTIRTMLKVDNIVNSAPAYGSLPAVQEEVETDSSMSYQSIQLVGTSHEAIEHGDVGDSAMAVIRNTSETATVEVGGDDASVFVPWFEIPPGETARIPRLSALAGTYLQSDEASTQVLVSLYEIVEPA